MEANRFAERLMADGSLLPLLDATATDAFATQVVEHLKREADRYWAIDPNRSAEFADLIISIGTQRSQPGTIALGTMARGDAFKLIGRTTEAWDTLGHAGLLYQQANDEVGWARTRIGRLVLGPMLNRVPEVLADAHLARAIFDAHADQERLLRLN